MRDNKIVQWARDNRVTIGVGAGCFVAGHFIRTKPHVTEINNTVAPVFNNYGPVVEGLSDYVMEGMPAV